MKKLILITFLFFANLTFSQNCLNFDARFVDCLDKWVVLPQNDDYYFTYGYVFLDETSNLTFQEEGVFEIENDCDFSPTKSKKVVRTKLEPSKVLVSVIEEDKFSELQISETPKQIKKSKENAETFFQRGYLYNKWGESQKALDMLIKVQEINPKFAGLDREMAFAYNSLAMYDKALEILYSLREKHPKDAYIYRELIFALTKTGKLKEAAFNLKHSMLVCKDIQYHGENCLNVLFQAFVENDKKIFFQWLKKAKTLNNGNKKALGLIKQMETEMKTKVQ